MRQRWFALLFLLPLCAHAAPPQQQWFTVLLDGRKIGSFESQRSVADGVVVTRQALDLSLDRAGSSVAMRSDESATETLDGQPLAFVSTTRLSGNDSVVEGRVHEGVIEISQRNSGETRQQRMTWPAGALLPEGLRLAGERAGLAPGTRYRTLAFQASTLDATEVVSVVQAAEDVDLPTGRRRLSPVAQTIALAGAPLQTRAWIDAAQTVYKMTMPMLGVELTLLACDRACASAPNQPSDIFERTLVQSPRTLTAQDLQGSLRYTLAARDGGAALNLPRTDEQVAERDGAGWRVTVHRHAQTTSQTPPQAADYQPNEWLQSRAPEVVALAQRAIADASSPHQRMQRIERFVRGYIRDKNLDVGYASALEVVRNPVGDCTEHAVLVAALGRAVGIATRVVDGLAYAPGFAGKERVFVPHAWVQAFVDGRWQSFDAALAGFDAGHIALSMGDGDPWRFYAGLNMLGRIDIKAVETIAPPASGKERLQEATPVQP